MMTDIAKMPKTRFFGKSNSLDECVTLSKPINAHGEIEAILAICARGKLSGAKPGSNPAAPDKKRTMPATKHTVMPTVKTAASPIITFATIFLLMTNTSTVSQIAAAVSSNSPK